MRLLFLPLAFGLGAALGFACGKFRASAFDGFPGEAKVIHVACANRANVDLDWYGCREGWVRTGDSDWLQFAIPRVRSAVAESVRAAGGILDSCSRRTRKGTENPRRLAAISRIEERAAAVVKIGLEENSLPIRNNNELGRLALVSSGLTAMLRSIMDSEDVPLIRWVAPGGGMGPHIRERNYRKEK